MRLEDVKRNTSPSESSAVMSDDGDVDRDPIKAMREEDENDDEPGIKLRFRKSSNFGSEFGSLKEWS